MNFILYSDIGESSINKSLGVSEYSYYFVLKAFQSVLSELGTIQLVQHPETEVDPLFEASRLRGEECVFLSFSPPHKTLIHLACPTISVFAWEYSTLPNEMWDDDMRNDWRVVFARHGRTITLSSYTAATVKEAMGAAFPVLAVPAPLWERFADVRVRCEGQLPGMAASLRVRGKVIDSHVLGLSADGLIQHLSYPGHDVQDNAVSAAPSSVPTAPITVTAPKNVRYRFAISKHYLLMWYREVLRDLLPLWLAKAVAVTGRQSYAFGRTLLLKEAKPQQCHVAAPTIQQVEELPEEWVHLTGVIFTSVLSPKDGRKNWFDMVTAFCWTFREVEDATLVLKMNERDLSVYHNTLLTLLSQLAPFKCRVVTLHAYLDDAAYEALIAATSYYVNTSLCEGLCLPLMEFMCCGKPVIAPLHTAMMDYIGDDVAFIVKSSLEHNVWPHDPRDLFRTLRYRLDWESICTAYRESYRIAKEAPQTYLQMGQHAMMRMQAYASDAVVKEQLRSFFSSGYAAGIR